MNFQRGGKLPQAVYNRAALRPGLAVFSLAILLLGTLHSPAILSPTILVTPNPTNGIAAMRVVFTAAAYTQPENIGITNYVWNFGDGSAPATNPAPVQVHVYMQAGTFTATLTGTGSNGVPYPGSLTQPIITPITLMATGAVFAVHGKIVLTGVTSGFYLTNGVLLAEAGSVPGQTAPVYAPVVLTATGVGNWTFSATLTVPLALNADGTHSLSAFPSGPVGNSSPLLVEYNDGMGNTGMLMGMLGIMGSP